MLSIGGGVIGFVASFVLTVERFELAADPRLRADVQLQSGAELRFGDGQAAGRAVRIPEPAARYRRVRGGDHHRCGDLRGRTPGGLVLGRSAGGRDRGDGFICWLIYSSLYSIGALCPYCMVVWAVTLPIFVFVSVRNAHASGLTSRSGVALAVARSHALILALAVTLVVVLIAVRFWSYWSSLY